MPPPIIDDPNVPAGQKPESDYNEEGGDESSEEEHLYDYHIEGYHPCHVK